MDQAEDAIINILERALDTLNSYLATHTFLVGDSLTLADIIMTCNLIMSFKALFTKEFSSRYPHFERYFWTMINQPEVKKVVGEVTQGEIKLAGGAPAKATAASPAKPTAAPPVKPTAAPVKAEKPKGTPKPKEAPKPKETPKPKEVSLDEEEEAPKPKVKNPLDLLPLSPFVIDNWKRLYSNTKAKDFAEVAIKGNFWDVSRVFLPHRELL